MASAQLSKDYRKNFKKRSTNAIVRSHTVHVKIKKYHRGLRNPGQALWPAQARWDAQRNKPKMRRPVQPKHGPVPEWFKKKYRYDREYTHEYFNRRKMRAARAGASYAVRKQRRQERRDRIRRARRARPLADYSDAPEKSSLAGFTPLIVKPPKKRRLGRQRWTKKRKNK